MIFGTPDHMGLHAHRWKIQIHERIYNKKILTTSCLDLPLNLCYGFLDDGIDVEKG